MRNSPIVTLGNMPISSQWATFFNRDTGHGGKGANAAIVELGKSFRSTRYGW
ncbi:hypothetical protein C8K61_112120 [Pseudomonas sp. GV071]|nr:hypothetical protein C8K61_112120 [Pseudomonas sp. GV071]